MQHQFLTLCLSSRLGWGQGRGVGLKDEGVKKGKLILYSDWRRLGVRGLRKHLR